MKILVIGSGGREHAIVDALHHSPHRPELFAAPGNGGIQAQSNVAPITDVNNIAGLLTFAKEERMDLTVVGPEGPLSLGIVDQFGSSGLKIVGPTLDNARLEWSKGYAKNFFRDHRIPTADFWECETAAQAFEVLKSASFPVVLKADGLAAGKGVIVANTREEAHAAVRDLMEKRTLGDAGAKLVIEKFLSGREVSFQVFSDGHSFQPMVAAEDHKRRFDGDTGPNTGGMGAYSSDSILSQAQRDEVIARIIWPTLEGAPTYTGVLYAGLMMTESGPQIIEYNCRMGDPETQVVLPRLQTDLVDVFVDIAEGNLSRRTLEWSSDSTASVVLVARDYPGKVETGKEIKNLDQAAALDGVKIYHAGTRSQDGKVFTAGGRVLNVTGRAPSLAQALERAYAAADMINFEGKDYRRDIGRKGLATNK